MNWLKIAFILFSFTFCFALNGQESQENEQEPKEDEPLIRDCRQSDSLALMALYNATAGEDWTVQWDLNQPVNTWYGVYLDGGNCVNALVLPDNNLTGAIPNELCNLTELTYLELSYNQLNDTIPVCIGDLTKMFVCSLQDNQLEGSIPSSIGNLERLGFLYLGNNQLSDTIPSSLGDLENLISLILSNNELSGTIPANLGQLENLQSLWLSNNQLQGAIPAALGQLINLKWLALNNNNLSGSLPEALGVLPDLLAFYVNDNQLSGDFPESYKNLCSLQYDFTNNVALPFGGDFDAFCNGESCLQFTVDGSELGCYSEKRITISIQEGTPGFIFKLEGPISGTSPSSSRVVRFRNAPSGTYKITITDANGCEASKVLTIQADCQIVSDDEVVSTSRSSVDETVFTIADFELSEQNLQVFASQPNPFTQKTTLPFSLSQTSDLNFTILTAAGQRVYQLKERFEAGTHQLNLDGAIFPEAGLYIYHIQYDGKVTSGKLVRM